MVFRSCVVTVGLYSRARVPSLLSSLFFYPSSNNALTNSLPTVTTASRVSRYNDLYRKSTVEAERGLVLSYAVTGRRKIHTVQEGEKKIERWKKIEETRPIDELMLDSVVEVSSTSTLYSKSKPWETLKEKSSRGSGFAIAEKKILTNAHVVMAMNDHTFVNVKRHGSPIKYKAKVQKISHECDLAILEIDSDKFWDGIDPLELGDIPPLEEVVSVVGGENICVTKGLVLRVETKKYNHSGKDLLSIQIDASIDHGNTGGPVIMGNKVVGVAYGFYPTKNSGFVIPTPIVKHFITGVQESRQYSGFGSLDLSYQSLENVHIRNHFKMSPEMTGILINKVYSSSGAHKILRKYDIILAIDGVPIGNDEKVPFQNKNRINFSHLVSLKKPGEKALVKVLRKGKEHEYNITLKPVKPNVKVQQFYNLPSYYIFGGFVFVPLTKAYSDNLSLSGCKCALYNTYRKAGEHQLVIISKILEDDINKGYESLDDLQVKKVNSVKVKNLKHLCELIEKCSTKDLRLVLEDNKVMVLNTESAKKATLKIMERHKIKSVISKDICLPMLLDDPFKDNRINLLPWSILKTVTNI
ncbi:PREDICTED: putative protease Do-like 11, mitochondrial [Camelina sativa]|uniref:Protease Do-like 11, mitochondrial n=1 Tax=Camelina sativa TaxID=90675 RepID=A0ABM1QN51_CAMSA|nr:PREDICTED: putative protease Do-like 11, mitochondrial [Camelina sativa]